VSKNSPARTFNPKLAAKDGTQRGLSHGKYCPEVHEKIVEGVREGQSKTMAFKLSGVNPDTVFDWMRQGREQPEEYPHLAKLYQDVEFAKAEAEAEALADIKTAGKQDAKYWQARAWYLERTNPKEFGRQENLKIEDDRPPVQINLNQVVLTDGATRDVARSLLRRATGFSPHEPLGLGMGDESEEEESLSPESDTIEVDPREAH